MTETGRRVRMVAVVIVLGLVLVGSWRGSDHDFPFGPFRMYATSGRSSGAVRTAALVGLAQGRTFLLDPETIGVRRAELEGQYPRFRAQPRLLGALATLYARNGLRLDELRLVEHANLIVDRRRVERPTEKVLAVWKRPR
jgi:hypothetical protein